MIAWLLVFNLQISPAAASAAGAVPADARAAIERANNDWLPAMKRQDARAIAEIYADDGVFVLPSGDSVKGRPAIEQLMRDRFSRTGPVVGGTLTQDNLVAAGSMIYEWGHAEITMGGRGNASASRVSARYLTVVAARRLRTMAHHSEPVARKLTEECDWGRRKAMRRPH